MGRIISDLVPWFLFFPRAGLKSYWFYMFMQQVASECSIFIQIYPTIMHVHNAMHAPKSLVQEDRHVVVILQWEGGGDHLLHKMRWASNKQHSLVTHTVGYFKKFTGVGASCGFLDDSRHTNTTRCTVGRFRSILQPYNDIICHLRPFWIWNSAAMHDSRLSYHTWV